MVVERVGGTKGRARQDVEGVGRRGRDVRRERWQCMSDLRPRMGVAFDSCRSDIVKREFRSTRA